MLYVFRNVLASDDYDAECNKVINCGVLPSLAVALKADSAELQALAAQVIAEIAKAGNTFHSSLHSLTSYWFAFLFLIWYVANL